MTCIENFNNWCPVNDADVIGIVAKSERMSRVIFSFS